MLNANISVNKKTSKLIVCAVAENNAEQINLYEDSNTYMLKQLFDKQSFSSSVIGSTTSRAIFISHQTTCLGSLCSCRSLAINFLSECSKDDLNDYLIKNQQYLRENVEHPLMSIFMEDGRCICASSYNKGDLTCIEVSSGEYELR